MSQDLGTLEYLGAKYEQEMIIGGLMFGSTLQKNKRICKESKPMIWIVISII